MPIELTKNEKIISLFRIFEKNKIKFNVLKTQLIDQLMTNKAKFIGQGASSIAYRVKNIYTNEKFLCLKVLKDVLITGPIIKKSAKKSLLSEDEEDENEEVEEPQIDMKKVQMLYGEYELISQLFHPNIVGVYRFYFGDKSHNPAILLEFCASNLGAVIDELTNAELVGIICEICSAMKYIHANKVIHRDLKMSNILINSKKHVRICDFGISMVVDASTYASTSGIGTLPFMAPELFIPNIKYTEKVDVYSFGVVMYFVETNGKMPEFRINQSYEMLKLPNTINKLSQSIIKSCWSTSPEKRPSFENILNLIIKNNFSIFNDILQSVKNLNRTNDFIYIFCSKIPIFYLDMIISKIEVFQIS